MKGKQPLIILGLKRNLKHGSETKRKENAKAKKLEAKRKIRKRNKAKREVPKRREKYGSETKRTEKYGKQKEAKKLARNFHCETEAKRIPFRFEAKKM